MAKSITIGQVCKVITGKLDANAADENGKYPFFTCSVAPLRINNFAYDLECVLIAGNGDLNVKYYNGKFNAYQRTYIISLKDGVSDVSVRYLYAFFLSYIDTLRKRSIGSTIKYIRLGDITEASIFLPSFPQQQRIVDILDREFAKIDALKANAEKSLQAAKDLFQATLKKVLEPKEGWLNTTIGDLCESVKYGTSKPSSSTGRYTYLRMNNITNDGFLTLADTKRIDITAEEEDKYLVRKGDILFNRTNSRELVGKSCVFQEDEQMVIAGYIIRLRLKNGINPCFVSYYINYEPVRAELRKLSIGAVHQANINAKTIQSFRIALPDNREEQDGIVDVLSHAYRTISNLQENYQKTLTLCDELKQSLLHKAFNGEL